MAVEVLTGRIKGEINLYHRSQGMCQQETGKAAEASTHNAWAVAATIASHLSRTGAFWNHTCPLECDILYL